MEESDEIIHHPLGNLEYRAIELENGLTALLISENNLGEGESYASASMVVRIGSFHDPPDIPGLSHFLGIISIFCLKQNWHHNCLTTSVCLLLFQNTCSSWALRSTQAIAM